MFWKWLKDRKNLVSMIVLQTNEIDRLRAEIERLEEHRPVDNFHQVKTPFDTQAFLDATKKKVVDEMAPYLREEAHQALRQLFFRQDAHDRSPRGEIAAYADAEDMFEVHVTFPEMHRRMGVYVPPGVFR